jgi:16S rRNA processing protein RimM
MKGYLLIDVQNGELGKIDEIYFMPAQTLLEFKFQGNEIMLPCHEETIVKINHSKKEVLVNLPEGLLDVYLKK